MLMLIPSPTVWKAKVFNESMMFKFDLNVGMGLDPRQFFTQFPHTPDNSFLGFAVHQPLDDNSVERYIFRCVSICEF